MKPTKEQISAIYARMKARQEQRRFEQDTQQVVEMVQRRRCAESISDDEWKPVGRRCHNERLDRK